MKAILLPVLLIIIGFNFSGCQKDDDASLTKLDGLWIEQQNKSDTLDFTFGKDFGSENYLVLRRGKETSGGYNGPKYGSGLYRYTLKGDSISLLSAVSSCYGCYKNYYFKTQNGRIIIGDFYNNNSVSQKTVTFIKLQ